MKIGIVCYPTFGGSGVVATELGKSLAEQGHKVHFITYSQPIRLDNFNENLFYHEVSFDVYPLFEYPPYELALTSKIINVVKFEKLDLLHVHYAIPHAAAAYLAKQILLTENIHIPVITTLHGTDITIVGKDMTFEPVVNFSINQSDGVSAVSAFLRDDTLRHFNITNHIEVIPDFIDLKRFQKQRKEHFKKAIAPEGEKILVHTSNFRPVKRVLDVIKIFEIVHKSIKVKLILVGDGPDRIEIENYCRQSQLCTDIRFLGKQEPVEELLSVCDLFLMPSETESFGLAALEAMACEVPVISTNTGGLPELNINGVTGFTSQVGDVNKMAMDTLFIFKEENLAKFKHNALERAKVFDIQKVRPLYEDFYHRVTERYGGHRGIGG